MNFNNERGKEMKKKINIVAVLLLILVSLGIGARWFVDDWTAERLEMVISSTKGFLTLNQLSIDANVDAQRRLMVTGPTAGSADFLERTGKLREQESDLRDSRRTEVLSLWNFQVKWILVKLLSIL
jgi:hypothetical protein